MIGTIGGERTNGNVGSDLPRSQCIPKPGESPQGGGGGFPRPEVRIRDISAYWSYLIAGGRRAITHKVDYPHDCYAFLVGKGSRGACIGVKYVHVGGNNHYLWWGEGAIDLPAGVG